jgi:GTP-binding protein
MSKLWQARFFTTVNQLRDLPKTQVPELAFAGRSNAGKSTAINILTNQKGLAFASKTPGRTQHINFFSIGGAHVAMHRKDPTKVEEIEGLLVDLPGYGYAEVSGDAKLHWQRLLGDYVQRREQLAALVLIIGSPRRANPSTASSRRSTSSTATNPSTPCARRSRCWTAMSMRTATASRSPSSCSRP